MVTKHKYIKYSEPRITITNLPPKTRLETVSFLPHVSFPETLRDVPGVQPDAISRNATMKATERPRHWPMALELLAGFTMAAAACFTNNGSETIW